MRKTRIIGVVNLLGDVVVQSVNFKKYLPIGNPRIVIEYLNNWGIDEIVILNITRKKNLLKKIPKFVKNSFVPITAGGGISNLEEIIPILISHGLAGIEVHYGDYGDAQVNKLLKLAELHNIVATGGSDYHGVGGKGEPQMGQRGPESSVVADLESLRRK